MTSTFRNNRELELNLFSYPTKCGVTFPIVLASIAIMQADEWRERVSSKKSDKLLRKIKGAVEFSKHTPSISDV